MLNPASPTSASCLDPTPENLFYPPKKGDYIYFETPPFQPGEPATVSLSRAADASMLAYARFVQQRMALADLQGILAAAGYPGVQPIGDCFVGGAHTGRGYFAYRGSHALLAFRGTEADNNNDKAADAEINQTPEAVRWYTPASSDILIRSGARLRNVSQFIEPTIPTRTSASQGTAWGRRWRHWHSRGSTIRPQASLRSDVPAWATPLTAMLFPPQHAHARAIAWSTIWNIVTHVPTDLFNVYTHPSMAIFWLDPGHTLRVNPPALPSDRDAIAKLPDGFLTTHWMEGLPDPLPEPLADTRLFAMRTMLGCPISGPRPLADGRNRWRRHPPVTGEALLEDIGPQGKHPVGWQV